MSRRVLSGWIGCPPDCDEAPEAAMNGACKNKARDLGELLHLPIETRAFDRRGE
jgi:hypothetical protein